MRPRYLPPDAPAGYAMSVHRRPTVWRRAGRALKRLGLGLWHFVTAPTCGL